MPAPENLQVGDTIAYAASWAVLHGEVIVVWKNGDVTIRWFDDMKDPSGNPMTEPFRIRPSHTMMLTSKGNQPSKSNP